MIVGYSFATPSFSAIAAGNVCPSSITGRMQPGAISARCVKLAVTVSGSLAFFPRKAKKWQEIKKNT
jgi:hypothetical protein